MFNPTLFITKSKERETSFLERDFLIYCSRTTIDDEIKERLKSLAASHLDWFSLVEKAARQGVAQFLYLHLSMLDEVWSTIPKESKDRLKQFYYKILERNWLIQLELHKVVLLLNQEGIEAIVLKGASLLETVYKNIGLRPMSDVDLLVKRKNLTKIRAVLQGAGYQKPDFLDQESLEKFGGEVYLYKEGGVFLDIHTNLSQYERFQDVFRIDLDEEIWNKSKIIKGSQGDLRILNPNHLIMHLCMHHAIVHSFAGLFRFCDIREVILTYQKDIDWPYLIVKARLYKMKRIVYYSLVLTQQLFGKIISEDILEALKPNTRILILVDFLISKKRILSLPDVEHSFKKIISQLFLMDGLFNTIRVVIKMLFPSREWLIYHYDKGQRKSRKKFSYRLEHLFRIIFNLT
ncbi:MAG: nucleotidyltransferase family protein [Candidatus Omnitrophota bacterium]|nr:nucleotidyltransferase family protein [Candidatus Omnitrophota bacterium]